MHTPLYGYNQSNAIAEPAIATTETIPIRTSFIAPEGVYRQMTVNEFFRANRIQNQVAGSVCNTPVRFSFLRIPTSRLSYAEEVLPSTSGAAHHQDVVMENQQLPNEMSVYVDRICHNIGREIYVLDYTSLVNPSPAKQVDKRVYKGTFPTCHDFKQSAATFYSCDLLVGFSAGQIQLVDPSQKEVGVGSSSKLFNEDRLIDKTAVTCLKWVPGEDQLFAASYASGNIYFYNEELSSTQTINYQVVKQGIDHSVHGCKAKAERNPLYRWSIGKGAINKFEFAGQDSSLLATASQDGFLRVFDWKTMDQIGFFKSYFGGLLSLAWSPDLRYIATGGEDDLLTLYSISENRVVCRGQAHKSWISEVAFDCYAPEFLLERHRTLLDGEYSPLREDAAGSSLKITDGICSHNERHFLTAQNSVYPIIKENERISSLIQSNHYPAPNCAGHQLGNTTSLALLSNGHATNVKENSFADGNAVPQPPLLYRIGTVGHDCQLCLWDISEDILAAPLDLHQQFDELTESPSSSNFACVSPRNTTIIPIGIGNALTGAEMESSDKPSWGNGKGGGGRFKKFHKRGFSFGSRLAGNDRSKQHATSSNGANSAESTLKRGENFTSHFFGTAQCPRLEDVPMIEPLMCKKIAHERLGTLLFREDCIVTACQEGIICTWARPNLLTRQEAGHQDEHLRRDRNCNSLLQENCDGTCV
ncbi:hypothetical protein GPALN_012759 [Globodera pallida]|nr:hypothetical protein GPALN_012759 [Globodera pallida]